jgi:hypothetical protein
MADPSRTIDEIERENACHKQCQKGLEACLDAWKEWDKRHKKADPRIAVLGMERCVDAHFIADALCGRTTPLSRQSKEELSRRRFGVWAHRPAIRYCRNRYVDFV